MAVTGTGGGSNGKVLAGRYRVIEQLGRGGMGVVCRAMDEVLGREVAVKELRTFADASAAELAELRLRMQREARAAARIRHTGVVSVHDVAEEDGRPIIVMELVDGPSLADVLAGRGVLEPREAAAIGAKVADALGAAHAAGVLHRDVKPGNVLLERGGRVVLTDFGIATMDDPGDGAAAGLTQSGQLVGSLDFLAPERAQGRQPGPASDIWSLGAMLYAAVEGDSPFHRTSTWSTFSAIVTEPLPEPRAAGPLAPVLKALLAKEPHARPDARRARELLESVARDTPWPAAGSFGPPPGTEAADRTTEAPRTHGTMPGTVPARPVENGPGPGDTQGGSGGAQSGTAPFQPGFGPLRPESGHPQAGTARPGPTAGQPRPATGQPQPGAAQLRPGADQFDTASDQPQPWAPHPEPGTTQLQPGTGQPHLGTDQPPSGMGQPHAATGHPQPWAAQPHPATPQPQPGHPHPGHPHPGTPAPFPSPQPRPPRDTVAGGADAGWRPPSGETRAVPAGRAGGRRQRRTVVVLAAAVAVIVVGGGVTWGLMKTSGGEGDGGAGGRTRAQAPAQPSQGDPVEGLAGGAAASASPGTSPSAGASASASAGAPSATASPSASSGAGRNPAAPAPKAPTDDPAYIPGSLASINGCMAWLDYKTSAAGGFAMGTLASAGQSCQMHFFRSYVPDPKSTQNLDTTHVLNGAGKQSTYWYWDGPKYYAAVCVWRAGDFPHHDCGGHYYVDGGAPVSR